MSQDYYSKDLLENLLFFNITSKHVITAQCNGTTTLDRIAKRHIQCVIYKTHANNKQKNISNTLKSSHLSGNVHPLNDKIKLSWLLTIILSHTRKKNKIKKKL